MDKEGAPCQTFGSAEDHNQAGGYLEPLVLSNQYQNTKYFQSSLGQIMEERKVTLLMAVVGSTLSRALLQGVGHHCGESIGWGDGKEVE